MNDLPLSLRCSLEAIKEPHSRTIIPDPIDEISARRRNSPFPSLDAVVVAVVAVVAAAAAVVVVVVVVDVVGLPFAVVAS